LGRDKREAVNAEETGKEAFLLLVNPHHMESKGQAVWGQGRFIRSIG
jgi:hypothetical protein